MRPPLPLNFSFNRAALLSWLFALFLLAASISSATKKPPLQPINLNAATSEELQLVPGIGPATADKILLMRKSYGAFKSVDDLLAIRGIGKKRLDKMRRYLIAGRPAAGVKPPIAAPRSAQPANCASCATTTPLLKDASLPEKAAAKTTATSAKPADAGATLTQSIREPGAQDRVKLVTCGFFEPRIMAASLPFAILQLREVECEAISDHFPRVRIDRAVQHENR